MADEDTSPPIKLYRCLTEIEGTWIVNALRQAGIEARMAGAIGGDFRAEAPGAIWVLVHRAHADRAQRVIEEYRRTNEEIDWSKVDIGEPIDETESGSQADD